MCVARLDIRPVSAGKGRKVKVAPRETKVAVQVVARATRGWTLFSVGAVSSMATTARTAHARRVTARMASRAKARVTILLTMQCSLRRSRSCPTLISATSTPWTRAVVKGMIVGVALSTMSMERHLLRSRSPMLQRASLSCMRSEGSCA